MAQQIQTRTGIILYDAERNIATTQDEQGNNVNWRAYLTSPKLLQDIKNTKDKDKRKILIAQLSNPHYGHNQIIYCSRKGTNSETGQEYVLQKIFQPTTPITSQNLETMAEEPEIQNAPELDELIRQMKSNS